MRNRLKEVSYKNKTASKIKDEYSRRKGVINNNLRREDFTYKQFSTKYQDQMGRENIRGLDTDNASKELTRLDLINKMGGYYFPEANRIDRLVYGETTINDSKYALIQPALEGNRTGQPIQAIEQKPYELLSVPNEHLKYKEVLELIKKQIREGHVSDKIVIVNMNINQFVIVTKEELEDEVNIDKVIRNVVNGNLLFFYEPTHRNQEIMVKLRMIADEDDDFEEFAKSLNIKQLKYFPVLEQKMIQEKKRERIEERIEETKMILGKKDDDVKSRVGDDDKGKDDKKEEEKKEEEKKEEKKPVKKKVEFKKLKLTNGKSSINVTNVSTNGSDIEINNKDIYDMVIGLINEERQYATAPKPTLNNEKFIAFNYEKKIFTELDYDGAAISAVYKYLSFEDNEFIMKSIKSDKVVYIEEGKLILGAYFDTGNKSIYTTMKTYYKLYEYYKKIDDTSSFFKQLFTK